MADGRRSLITASQRGAASVSTPPTVSLSARDVSEVAAAALMHVQQQHSWDCGLACAQMILNSAGASTTHDELSSGVENNSVWTIDVALALARRGVVAVTYHTSLAGVNPAHRHLSFYTEFDVDAARIPPLFDEAVRLGVVISEARLPLSTIVDRLARHRSVFIVLVDLRHMTCATCAAPHPATLLQFTYAGHYVLVTGFRKANRVSPAVNAGSAGPGCATGALASASGSDVPATSTAGSGADHDALYLDGDMIEYLDPGVGKEGTGGECMLQACAGVCGSRARAFDRYLGVWSGDVCRLCRGMLDVRRASC